MKPSFPFKPIFFLIDKNRFQLRSIAVEKIDDNGYEGLSFKEYNTGWELNPFKIGKGYITLTGDFDFTENAEEAILHASLNPPKPLHP